MKPNQKLSKEKKGLNLLDDYMKRQPLEVKMSYFLWGVWYSIQDFWWLSTNTCPHESTIGRVNSKKRFCLLCKKEINNED